MVASVFVARQPLQDRAQYAAEETALCEDCSTLEQWRAGAAAFTRSRPFPTITGPQARETTASEFPEVGSILLDDRLQCTATLIDADSLLTAAHCFYDGKGRGIPNTRFKVTFNIRSEDGKRFEIGEVAFPKPPNAYRYLENRNDIAIVHLKTAPGIGSFRRAAANPDALSKGTVLTAVGFGLTTDDKGRLIGDGVQRKGPIRVGSFPAGRFQYAGEGNTCRGDSGGPALLDDLIVGVTSVGDRQCRQYGVDTRVADYEPWIRTETSQ